MSEVETKEVWFNYYCVTCKYANVTEDKDPCCTCMNTSHNINSHKPVNYEAHDKKSINPTPNCMEKLNHLAGDYQKIHVNKGPFS